MRLIRISGHSGAGKSRLIRALALRGFSCPRTVLYTSRQPRPGETHGRDYYFLSREAIAAIPKAQFLIRPVHNMLQAVDLAQLQIDLQSNDFVLIEIFHELWADLMSLMVERIGNRLRTTSVFMTAVNPMELRNLPDDPSRADRIRTEVAKLLRWRSKDEPDNITRRSENAVAEILDAIGPSGLMQYSKILHSSPEGPDKVDDWTTEGAPVGRAATVIDEFISIATEVVA